MKLQNLIHIVIGIVCIGLLPGAQAVVPAPAEAIPDATLLKGHKPFRVSPAAVTTPQSVGIRSLASHVWQLTTPPLALERLISTAADNNTATGAAALLFNTTGYNTANGAVALFNNTAGFNTAIGAFALFSNTTAAPTRHGGSLATQPLQRTRPRCLRSLATPLAATTRPSVRSAL